MIRTATAVDLPRLVEMGCRFIAETHYRGLIAANPASLRTLAEGLLENSSAAIFVAEREGGVDGMLGVLAFDHPISGERVATELFWWVDPAARGTTGMHLLRAAERFCVEQKALTLQMVAPSAEVERLYERLGFTHVEATYQRSLAP